MKFSQSLLWNAVSDWRSHYIAYDALKASIYQMEKDALLDSSTSQHRDAENSPLLNNSSASSDASTREKRFTMMLDAELEKITDFYVDKERELLGDLVLLKEEIERSDSADEHDESGNDDEASSDEEENGTWSKNTWNAKKGMTKPRRKSSYSYSQQRRQRAGSTASSIPPADDNEAEASADAATRKPSKKKRRMSTSASEADDWTWRDDRRIMYKRRINALFTVLASFD